ncbi:hypothetical protein [Streptomyces sp. DASNCL29]|uniref:hypothetical protein n=1 Tax=Streptomyces sp. DASNCL29 TaxID=2583819 RepID=UPI00148673E3|nr:hypothetical protein [Streptomyces sp. DASNCL29]
MLLSSLTTASGDSTRLLTFDQAADTGLVYLPTAALSCLMPGPVNLSPPAHS